MLVWTKFGWVENGQLEKVDRDVVWKAFSCVQATIKVEQAQNLSEKHQMRKSAQQQVRKRITDIDGKVY